MWQRLDLNHLRRVIPMARFILAGLILLFNTPKTTIMFIFSLSLFCSLAISSLFWVASKRRQVPYLFWYFQARKYDGTHTNMKKTAATRFFFKLTFTGTQIVTSKRSADAKLVRKMLVMVFKRRNREMVKMIKTVFDRKRFLGKTFEPWGTMCINTIAGHAEGEYQQIDDHNRNQLCPVIAVERLGHIIIVVRWISAAVIIIAGQQQKSFGLARRIDLLCI